MKKLISIVSAFAMTAALAVPFSAAAEDKGAVISTEIQPAYVVTIPADLTVVQNQEKTTFGAVKLEKAQIEPDKCISVTLISDNKLKHEKDATKTLAYTIQEKTSGDEDVVFTSATYLKAGEKTDLTVNIAKTAWEKAYAGVYSNTVTFRIAYTNIQTEQQPAESTDKK